MSDKIPYVPDCAHDVFVSYAQVDNYSVGGDQGWVHTLVNDLRELVARALGRNEWGDIWLDTRIEAGDAITPEVQAALDDSALMLVIMSEGYLASPWCSHERERFLARMQQQGGEDGRVFLVHILDVDRKRQPEVFRDRIGVEFFQRERDGDAAHTLGFPVPDPDNPEDRLYYRRLDDLSRRIAERLRELREQTGAAPAAAAVPDTLGGGETSAVSRISTGTGTGQPNAIFVAETTPDLMQRRDALIRQLDQSVTGLEVLPASYYARAPDAFADAMRRDLASSLLFVQILGPYASVQTDGLPCGYEGLQLQLAEQQGLPILRWHDPELDRQAVSNPELFGGAEITVCGFEDFKRQVETQARRLLLRRDAPTAPAGDTMVLIVAAAADEDTAYLIADTLEAGGIGYEVADEQGAIDELIEQQLYQGLMVVYGQCERDWAKDQVRSCRNVMLKLKDCAPACAVFDQPRPDKPRLGIKPPKLHWLSALETLDFQRYVQALQGATG